MNSLPLKAGKKRKEKKPLCYLELFTSQLGEKQFTYLSGASLLDWWSACDCLQHVLTKLQNYLCLLGCIANIFNRLPGPICLLHMGSKDTDTVGKMLFLLRYNQQILFFHYCNAKWMLTSLIWFHFAVSPHSHDKVLIGHSGVGLWKRQSVVRGLSSSQTNHTDIYWTAPVSRTELSESALGESWH